MVSAFLERNPEFRKISNEEGLTSGYFVPISADGRIVWPAYADHIEKADWEAMDPSAFELALAMHLWLIHRSVR
jgi:hypothetical protein